MVSKEMVQPIANGISMEKLKIAMAPIIVLSIPRDNNIALPETPGNRKKVNAIKPIKKIYPFEKVSGEIFIFVKTKATKIPQKK